MFIYSSFHHRHPEKWERWYLKFLRSLIISILLEISTVSGQIPPPQYMVWVPKHWKRGPWIKNPRSLTHSADRAIMVILWFMKSYMGWRLMVEVPGPNFKAEWRVEDGSILRLSRGFTRFVLYHWVANYRSALKAQDRRTWREAWTSDPWQ